MLNMDASLKGGMNMYIKVDSNKCSVCGACVSACPSDAVSIRDGIAVVDDSKCILCKRCIDVCPTGAISEVSELEVNETGSKGEQQGLEVFEAEPVSVIETPDRTCFSEFAIKMLPAVFDALMGLIGQRADSSSGQADSFRGQSALHGHQRRRRQKRGSNKRR